MAKKGPTETLGTLFGVLILAALTNGLAFGLGQEDQQLGRALGGDAGVDVRGLAPFFCNDSISPDVVSQPGPSAGEESAIPLDQPDKPKGSDLWVCSLGQLWPTGTTNFWQDLMLEQKHDRSAIAKPSSYPHHSPPV